MMEFQLRNFQTLTEGTKVTLTYELNKYTLKVLQCKPEKGNNSLEEKLCVCFAGFKPSDHNCKFCVYRDNSPQISCLLLVFSAKLTLSLSLSLWTVYSMSAIFLPYTPTGISILNADITTDITEPADLSRFVGYFEIM